TWLSTSFTCCSIHGSSMSELVSTEAAAPHATPNQRAWARFKRNRLALGSLLFVAALALLLVAWPFCLRLVGPSGLAGARWTERFQPDRLSDDQFQKPGIAHWFGTDVHGRDLFSRVLAGGRVSLLVGLVGTGVSLVIGVLWGAVAGYAGGRTDTLLMRAVDILYSLPSIIFVIVLITTLESVLRGALQAAALPSWEDNARLLLLVVGLGSVSWLNMARIVRGQVLSLRQRPFVEASRALGAGPIRILAKHIIPH